MKPEIRCRGSLLIAGVVEACGKEVVDGLSSLGKSIDTFSNFETDLAIAGFV